MLPTIQPNNKLLKKNIYINNDSLAFNYIVYTIYYTVSYYIANEHLINKKYKTHLISKSVKANIKTSCERWFSSYFYYGILQQ